MELSATRVLSVPPGRGGEAPGTPSVVHGRTGAHSHLPSVNTTYVRKSGSAGERSLRVRGPEGGSDSCVSRRRACVSAGVLAATLASRVKSASLLSPRSSSAGPVELPEFIANLCHVIGNATQLHLINCPHDFIEVRKNRLCNQPVTLSHFTHRVDVFRFEL